MTTGTVVRGSRTSASYFAKSWSGTNGKYKPLEYWMLGDASKAELKWNDYTCYVMTATQKPSNIGTYYVYGGIYPDSVWEATLRPKLACQAKLVAKVKASAPNLAVEVAQGHQTVSMALNALKSFGVAALALRRGDLGKAARALGVNPKASKLRPSDVAGRWLELQYGWLPTLQTIHEGMEWWANRQQTDRPRKLTYTARATETFIHDASASPSLYSMKGPMKVRYQVVAELEEETPLNRTLGLTDPLSVAWELLPWSFVVDWFIPIGTFLEVLNVVPHLKGRFLETRSYKHVCRSVIFKNAMSNPHYVGNQTFETALRMQRTSSTTLTVGQPNFVPLSGALSPRRFANSVALAAQCFSSTGRLMPRRTKHGISNQKKKFDWEGVPDSLVEALD